MISIGSLSIFKIFLLMSLSSKSKDCFSSGMVSFDPRHKPCCSVSSYALWYVVENWTLKKKKKVPPLCRLAPCKASYSQISMGKSVSQECSKDLGHYHCHKNSISTDYIPHLPYLNCWETSR